MQKELRQLLREARRQGWRVERTKKGHYKLWPPDGGPPEILPGTPSDWRSLKNAIARLRRRGFRWEGR